MLTCMVNIVVLMALGYFLHVSGPLGSAMQRGVLGMFIANVSLPALFFVSLAREDFSHMSGVMLCSVVLAKLCMLCGGLVFGRVARESSEPGAGSQQLLAGIFGLLTTNGDEVGMGIPTMMALFPRMMPALFVLAGIQKMCFLPPALVLLGMSRALRGAHADAEGHEVSALAVLAQVLRAKAQDPLVLGILCGVLYNLFGPATEAEAGAWSVGGYVPGLFGGARVHPYVVTVCSTLGAAFPPLIFVLTGASSVGTYALLLDHDNILLPLTLVVLKSICLPTLIRGFLGLFGAAGQVKDFAFVFGMFPASGANLVYINVYEPSPRQEATMMGALGLGKIVAFPLLLLASRMLFEANGLAVRAELLAIDRALMILSLPLCAWTFACGWFGTRRPDALLVVLAGLECTLLASGLWPQPMLDIVRVARWAADLALLLLAASHVRRLMRRVRTAPCEPPLASHYTLMQSEEANAYERTQLLRFASVGIAAMSFALMLLGHSTFIESGSRKAPAVGVDDWAPGLLAAIHAGFAASLGLMLLVLLHYDAELDLRELDVTHHLLIQRVGLLVVLGAAQMVVSSAALAALASEPTSELPTGSLALMLALLSVLRNGRGVVIFLLFGWQRVVDAWWWLNSTQSWLGG